jgi:large repetitive protein
VSYARALVPGCLALACLGALSPPAPAAPPVRVTVGDATLTESNREPRPMRFAVRLSRAVGQPVRVPFWTRDGSAHAGRAYRVRRGQLLFAPGQRLRRVEVRIYGDTVDEFDESFQLRLGRPTPVVHRRADRARAPLLRLTDAVGRGTIVDDDPPPYLYMHDIGVLEGTGLMPEAAFELVLTVPSGKPVTVRTTTGAWSALPGADYVELDRDVTIPPGRQTWPVVVHLQGDAVDETDESFVLGLSANRNAHLWNWRGIARITDDDAPPSISVDDVSVAEGSGTGTTPASFTVSLSAPSGLPVSVSYATADGTARAGSDFADASGTLDFVPGETTKRVTVQVTRDSLDEPSEAFFLRLATPVNATSATGQARATILDDDP